MHGFTIIHFKISGTKYLTQKRFWREMLQGFKIISYANIPNDKFVLPRGYIISVARLAHYTEVEVEVRNATDEEVADATMNEL